MIELLEVRLTEQGITFTVTDAAEKINELVKQVNLLTEAVEKLVEHTHDSRISGENTAETSEPYDYIGGSINTWFNNARKAEEPEETG